MTYSITESEQMILEQLWEHGRMSVMQLVEALDDITGWSKHTIISFLKRMEEKHTVTYEIEGRTKFYTAVPLKSEVVIESTQNVMDRFFGGRIGTLVSYMADAKQLTEEDVDELYALLASLKEEKQEEKQEKSRSKKQE